MYLIEYYSAIKNEEILPFAATWMDLEGIMLTEIIQKEKDKYYMTSLICRIHRKKNLQKKRSDLWLPEGVLKEGGPNVKTSNYKINEY
uniref:DUF1725 domain-containing protein n=1 Tax=Ailuropoda melanoleuca TaxID=9646 RepID=A0A7N5JGJ1_AILME